MKTSRLIMVALLSGCNLPPDLPPAYFFGDDTAVCTGARPVQFSTDLTFEVDVMILSGFSRDYTLDYLEAKNVTLEGSGQYVVQSVDKVYMPLRLPGAVAILIDQHGTYASVDSSNYRSKQLNQFIHELPSSSPFLVGGYAAAGLLADVPVEYATATFTNDSSTILDFLFGLSRRTGGISVLYDAASTVVGKFPPGSNRNLVMLVHGPDSVSSATLTTSVASANAQSVKVDIIYLGRPGEALNLVPLSARTGGLFVSCPSAGNMVTAFNHLNNIYTGEPVMMRIKVKFSPAVPLVSGQDTFHELTIHDVLDDVDLNTVPIYIKVP